ncbi:MAG: glycosyltransferase family 2 protein, partial [Alphaproteobacteria bacterium]|nr:glycosyltransferase family 2 protein [Alphaproteobacteria bacterium]
MTTPAAAGTQLSIVIPAYNEAERIGPTLERILAFLEEEGIRAEALVVDDGSTDGTAEVVRAFAPRFATIGRLGLLDHERNRGKGYSVRQGMLAAGGEHVLFTDSDLSTPIEEYPRLAAPLRRGDAEIAIGSRALDRSRVQVRQTWIRETSGRTFNLVVRKLTGLPFQDTQCGFKLFTRRAAQAVFALQTLEGFGFDVEVLYIATKLGFRAVEIPVVWRNVEGSRVRML